MFGSNKFCCGWVKAKVLEMHRICVNNRTKDNIVAGEVIVEGLGWEKYVIGCFHTIQ